MRSDEFETNIKKFIWYYNLFNAVLKSSMISSTFSIPVLNLISPGATVGVSSSRISSLPWVIDNGCSMRDSVPPRETAWMIRWRLWEHRLDWCFWRFSPQWAWPHSPLFPHRMQSFPRTVSWLSWRVRVVDGKEDPDRRHGPLSDASPETLRLSEHFEISCRLGEQEFWGRGSLEQHREETGIKYVLITPDPLTIELPVVNCWIFSRFQSS